VRSFFDAPIGVNAAPLELLQAALDELESKVQPAGRGTRVFPYNHVRVQIAQPDADRAAIEAVFAQLSARLRERLTEIRCEIPASLVVAVSVADGVSASEPVLRVDCRRDADASPVAAPTPATLQIRVVKGQCDRADYEVDGGGVSIGRGAEPADAFGRVRRNEIAFLDVRDGISETVARAHARIEFDPSVQAYLLFNESGSNPTFLLRGGRSLRVTPRDRRGVRLESGDHVQLGLAIVAVTVGD
jgi:FHA domain